MKVTNHWATPIAEQHIDLTDECRKALIRVVCKYGANIFSYQSDHPEKQYIQEFESISHKTISNYLTEAYNIPSKKQHIQARSFGNHQRRGGRTYPHYHNHYDGIMAHYLTAGDEFKVTKDYDVIPLEEKDKIEYEKLTTNEGYYAVQGDTLYRENSKVHIANEGETFEEKFPLQGSGKLIVCDPRVGINNLFSSKAISFTPKTGMTIIHSGSLWHESNTFLGNGFRVIIVVMFTVDPHTIKKYN